MGGSALETLIVCCPGFVVDGGQFTACMQHMAPQNKRRFVLSWLSVHISAPHPYKHKKKCHAVWSWERIKLVIVAVPLLLCYC